MFNFLSFLHDCYKGKTHSLLVSKRILTGAKIRKAGTTKGSDENQTTRFRHLESWQKTNRLQNAGMPGKSARNVCSHKHFDSFFVWGFDHTDG